MQKLSRSLELFTSATLAGDPLRGVKQAAGAVKKAANDGEKLARNAAKQAVGAAEQAIRLQRHESKRERLARMQAAQREQRAAGRGRGGGSGKGGGALRGGKGGGGKGIRRRLRPTPCASWRGDAGHGSARGSRLGEKSGSSPLEW